MTSAKVANINLFVADPHRASTFYATVFGFPAEPSMAGPDFPVLNAGACTLSFQPHSINPSAGSSGVSTVELGVEVTDVAACVKLLTQHGGTVRQENRMDWGHSVDALDPDGHSITLYKRS